MLIFQDNDSIIAIMIIIDSDYKVLLLIQALTWVMAGDPRHKVESRLITVDTLGFPLDSGVAVTLPGVPDITDTLPENMNDHM